MIIRTEIAWKGLSRWSWKLSFAPSPPTRLVAAEGSDPRFMKEGGEEEEEESSEEEEEELSPEEQGEHANIKHFEFGKEIPVC